MDIRRIDPNFCAEKIAETDITYCSCTAAPVVLHGLCRTEDPDRFLRMPEAYIHDPALNPGMQQLIHHTSGARIRFATDSPYIAVMAELSEVVQAPHNSIAGHSGLDIYTCRRGCHDYRFRKIIMPDKLSEDADRYFEGFYRFSEAGEHEVMIHLPLYNGVNQVHIGIKEGCSLFAPAAYEIPKPVCFYGDSITQGGCASHPGNNYPHHLSRWLNCDFINLGFSGSAGGEPEMADYIGTLDVSAIVINMDLRGYDIEEFARYYPRFYARIRAAQPDTPIILVSRGAFPKERRYAPKTRDFVLSNRVVMDTCLRGWESGDSNLYYIDGETLFGNADHDACTVDGTHPNDLGFYRMAERILPVLRHALTK